MGLDDLEDRVLTVRARSTPYGIEVTWEASYAPDLHPTVCDVVIRFIETWRPHAGPDWLSVDEFRLVSLSVRAGDDWGPAGMVVDSFGYGIQDLDDITRDDAPGLPLERLVAAVRDEAVRRRA